MAGREADRQDGVECLNVPKTREVSVENNETEMLGMRLYVECRGERERGQRQR